MTKKLIGWLVVMVAFIAIMLLANVLLGPDADKLQGVYWIVFTAIAVVILIVLYLISADNKAWEVGTRQVVYMAIGAALYGVFNWIFNTIPMPSVSQVALRPSVCIPIFFGYVFGPDTADRFLDAAGVQALIRGHQSCETGHSVTGRVHTLFSCKLPHYGNRKAAYMEVPASAEAPENFTGYVKTF